MTSRKFFIVAAAGVLLSIVSLAAAAPNDWADCQKETRESLDNIRVAIEACSRLISGRALRSEQRAKAYRNRGEHFAYIQNYDRALEDYSEAIRLRPADVASYRYYRALIYHYNKADYDRAIADLDEATRLDPTSGVYLWVRGKSYEAKGRNDEALRDYRAAVEVDPIRSDAPRESLARLQAKIATPTAPPAPAAPAPAAAAEPSVAAAADRDACRLTSPKALEACSRLIGSGTLQGSALAETYAVRASFYLLYNIDTERALADSNEAIRLDPKRPTGYLARAFSEGWKHEHDRALADLNEALRLDPRTLNDGGIWLLRGSVYLYHKQDYDRAIADADQGISLTAAPALLHALRSRAYLSKGANEHAAADLHRAVKADKDLVDEFHRFEQTVATTGNVFWAYANVFIGTPLASPAASSSAVPATMPSTAMPITPIAKPSTVKEVFEQYGLLGFFAADCSAPASEQNQFIVHRPNGDNIQRDSMISQTVRADLYVIDKVADAGAGRIALGMVNERGRIELIMQVEPQQWRVIDGTRENGDKLVSSGRGTGATRDVQAWFRKCG
jgi:tetratricopeptide (TPR) repeat protein